MENNDYLSRAQNRIIRIATVLDHRIGDIYNNESLIMTNGNAKANNSIRLYQTRNYDSGISSIMFQDSDGGFYPLELRLTQAYGELDYAFLDSKGSNAIRSFLKSDANADAVRKNEVLSLFKTVSKEASLLFKNSPAGVYERIAYKYKRIMNTSSLYPLLPILARLDLYSSLIGIDARFAGINVEEAMLIRREEHQAALEEDGHERMTLFLTECVLDGITRAADQLFDGLGVGLVADQGLRSGFAPVDDHAQLRFTLLVADRLLRGPVNGQHHVLARLKTPRAEVVRIVGFLPVGLGLTHRPHPPLRTAPAPRHCR